MSGTRRKSIALPLFWVVSMLWWTGCGLNERRQVDEETEANFIDGRTALRLKDFERAITHFEAALESNPRSAAAHRELGILYCSQRTNYVRSLFHFERFRELRPNDVAPEVEAQERRATMFLVQQNAGQLERSEQQNQAYRWKQLSDQKDREIEQLRNEVQRLTQAAIQTPIEAQGGESGIPTAPLRSPQGPAPVRDTDSLAGRVRIPTNSGSIVSNRNITGVNVSPRPVRVEAVGPQTPHPVPATPRSPATAKASHLIVQGDNLSRIAKRYGVTVQAIRAVNPGLNPNNLRVGATLNIPAAR